MRILVYGLNFAPEPIGIGKYTGEMVQWLAEQGHEVRVVTAPPYYPAWRVMNGYSSAGYRKQRQHNTVVWRCPIWVPKSQTGLRRVLHLLSFAASSAPVALMQVFWKPDVVWTVAPSLFSSPVAWLAARLSGARAWLHIQDFEVEAAFETGLLHAPAARSAALWIERALLTRFDRVSSISRNMIQRLTRIGVEETRCVLFQNWVDPELIHPLQQPSEFRRELGLATDAVVVLYSGNMGEKQGLDTLFRAARLLADHAAIRFVVCGDGSERERLLAQFGDLTNVIWLRLQPFTRLNDLLNLADIHALPQLGGVADLVMPSKLSGMLASGRPVVATALPGTQVHDVVSECGFTVSPEDPQALAAAIQELAGDRRERKRLGAAARDLAVLTLGSQSVLSQFERNLELSVIQ